MPLGFGYSHMRFDELQQTPSFAASQPSILRPKTSMSFSSGPCPLAPLPTLASFACKARSCSEEELGQSAVEAWFSRSQRGVEDEVQQAPMAGEVNDLETDGQLCHTNLVYTSNALGGLRVNIRI